MLKDARDYQILFLLLFLILGIGTRDWTLKPELMATIFASCLLTQRVLSWAIAVPTPNSEPTDWGWRSAIITALGLCLLLRAESYTTMAIAAICAIGSKFLFKLDGKHWFNPANFGIIVALVFCHYAWVSPGQWGDDILYAFVFAGAGGIVLKRVGRLDTTVAFLGSYACLELIRNLWLGWSGDVFVHRLMSGSLLLFAMFMITDPRSIPNARGARLIWAIAIAVLTFVLRNQFFLSTAVFIALFALAPLTILLDQWFQAPRFAWLGAKSAALN